MADGHAQIAAASFEGGRISILVVEAGVLFISHLFASWNFQKLYMEVPGYNLPQIRSRMIDIFDEEGRLIDHTFKYDRRWDLHILAIHRNQWELFGLGQQWAT